MGAIFSYNYTCNKLNRIFGLANCFWYSLDANIIYFFHYIRPREQRGNKKMKPIDLTIPTGAIFSEDRKGSLL